MNIVIISGSIRKGRQSHKVAKILHTRLLSEENLEVELIDLKETPLPIMEKRLSHHPNPPSNIQKIGKQLQWADAIILVSPEYNGSYSGVLKNTLDYYYSEINHKVVGVAAASEGAFGGVLAVEKLQSLILTMKGYPIPASLLVPHVQDNATNGGFSDEFTQKEFKKFLTEFLSFARLVAAGKHKEPISV